MAKVVAYVDRTTGEKESAESMLRRFKKQVLNDQILYEVKRREYFMNPALKRKMKSIEAQKRQKKNYKPKF